MYSTTGAGLVCTPGAGAMNTTGAVYAAYTVGTGLMCSPTGPGVTWIGAAYPVRRRRNVLNAALSCMLVAVSPGNQIPGVLLLRAALNGPTYWVEMTSVWSFSATLNPSSAHLPM